MFVVGGPWYNALEESGFEGVADIISYRNATNNSTNKKYETDRFSKGSHHSGQYDKNGNETLWGTAYPNKPMFISAALSRYKSNEYDDSKGKEKYFGVKVQWAGGNPESRSVEVFIVASKGDSKNAYRSERGVCFSTYGDVGCK